MFGGFLFYFSMGWLNEETHTHTRTHTHTQRWQAWKMDGHALPQEDLSSEMVPFWPVSCFDALTYRVECNVWPRWRNSSLLNAGCKSISQGILRSSRKQIITTRLLGRVVRVGNCSSRVQAAMSGGCSASGIGSTTSSLAHAGVCTSGSAAGHWGCWM